MLKEGRYVFTYPSLFLYDGHVMYLWCKSIRGVVADEPHSDS